MSKDSTPESDAFAAAAARKRALADQLAGRPLEHVIGVVDARGTGAWPEQGRQSTLSFSLQSWKVPPGPLKNRPLTLGFNTSRGRFYSLCERIPYYALVP